ncbi:hypothetical protein PG995_002761 [Apiospora arundinis]
MADILGTTSATVTLFETAVDIIQRIRAARQRVRATSRTLEDTTQQLDTLYHSIAFLKAESSLHTAHVVCQVSRLTDAANELNAFFEKLRQSQESHNPFRKHLHAFAFGNDEDNDLAAILSRLESARADLMLCVQVSAVGLVRDMTGGFRVITATLSEVNRKVEQALEVKLSLYEMVANRPSDQDGRKEVRGDEIARLNRLITTEMSPEGRSSAPGSDPNPAQDATPDEVLIYGNVTQGQDRIMTGDVGVQEWRKRSSRKTKVVNNTFGPGLRLMTGNAGPGTMNNFWD